MSLNNTILTSTSLKKTSLILCISQLLACSFFCTASSPALAQERKMSAAEKRMQKQRLLEAGKALSPAVAANASAAVWTDISMAPGNFPLPIFRGNQTKFLKVANAGAIDSLNKFGKQLSLQSKDPANIVYAWYLKYLPASGFKIDEKLKQPPGGRAYVLKADSDKMQAMISIVPMDDAAGPGAQIQLTASYKASAKH